MTEQLLLSPPAPKDLGPDIAVSGQEVPNEKIHDINVGDYVFQTNLPEALNIFDDEIYPQVFIRQHIRPSEVNKLPEGNYWIVGSYVDKFEFDDRTPREYRRDVVVKPTRKGRVITTESLSPERWMALEDPSAGRLMESLGYEVTKDKHDGHEFISGVPVPDTLKACAAKQGVEVDFFEDQNYIDGEDYLRSISNEHFPVSTKSEIQYWHDISDDHITTMVLGGDELKSALKDIASSALASGSRLKIDVTAKLIDRYTATLRAVISYNSDFVGEAYGLEQGRRTHLEQAQQLGIPDEVAERILKAAQTKAREFEMNVKDLL